MVAWREWFLIAVALLMVLSLLWAWRNDFGTTFVTVSTLVCVAILAVPAFFEWRWQHNESRYTSAASVVGGKKLQVRCQRLFETMVDIDGYAGHVAYSEDGTISNVANLDYQVCQDMKVWPSVSPAAATPEQVDALHVLVHEAEHVAGVLNEAQADCYAIQHTVPVAKKLGLSAVQANVVAARYYLQMYPHMPAGYRDQTRCVRGGEWDLNLTGFAWPSTTAATG